MHWNSPSEAAGAKTNHISRIVPPSDSTRRGACRVHVRNIQTDDLLMPGLAVAELGL